MFSPYLGKKVWVYILYVYRTYIYVPAFFLFLPFGKKLIYLFGFISFFFLFRRLKDY